jgi:hypothetical protein
MDMAGRMEKTLPTLEDERITMLYERLYFRLPSASEAERCLKFIRAQSEPSKAWPPLIQTLMAANEFVFLR